jgi:hypothetical protein
VILPQLLIKFNLISYIQGKNSIKQRIVIYNSRSIDLGNNLAWPNSLKEIIVSYNSLPGEIKIVLTLSFKKHWLKSEKIKRVLNKPVKNILKN